MTPTAIARSRGCLLGLAVGDAVGTTVEFSPRGSFAPLTDMVGGGPFGLAAGEWTDDTSMALCLATSLVERGGFDLTDQIKRYCDWYQRGYLSSNGVCFDIGLTVRKALTAFLAGGAPDAGQADPMSAGNGSIMRLAPVAIRYRADAAQAEAYAAASSRTTHGARESVDACRMLARVLVAALGGADKARVLAAAEVADVDSPGLRAIGQRAYASKTAREIRGSGYVVASLEAALWAFARTDSFRDAVLAAANLGEDADTTAAVCGQIAGAFYGIDGIPAGWLDKLAMRAEITTLADRLHSAGAGDETSPTPDPVDAR